MKESDYSDGFYGTVFRQTHPVVNGEPLYEEGEDGYVIWTLANYKSMSNYMEGLKQVLTRREDMPYELYDNLAELGRILKIELGCSNTDGVMVIESQLFFDEFDIPPIDTWFYLENDVDNRERLGVLYCWIPEHFVSIVEHSLYFDFYKACEWFDFAYVNP
nr:hypothetical protein [uncultured Mucilaginibacter sp.]